VTIILNNRSLPFESPGCAAVIIRSNRTFVPRNRWSHFLFCQLFYPWKFTGYPFIHQYFIFLICLMKGFLRCESKFFQNSSHRDITELYGKLIFDQLADHGACPKRKWEFVLERIFVMYHSVKLVQLIAIELRGSAIDGLCLQRSNTTVPIFGNPLVNAGPMKSESLYNCLRAFSSFNSFYRPDTDFFSCLMSQFSSIKIFHKNTIAHVGCVFEVIYNTSVIPSTITAFAFNAMGTVENYEGSWYLWDDPITPPQKNKFGEDFKYGLSIFPSNWNGGNPGLGIKEGESQTFNFQVSDPFGLFDNAEGYSFIVRYQSVGLDGEGSDVGGSAVPIPGAALLLGSGMMGVLALRRRRLYSQ
jgi:hypothetical protein